MPELTVPDIEIKFLPKSAIPFKNRHGLTIADNLGQLMGMSMGDSGGVSINPTASNDWLSGGLDSGKWRTLAGVTAYRFLPDNTFLEGTSARKAGTDAGVAGFALTGRLAWLDAKTNSTTLNTENTDQLWEATQGTWETVKPPGSPSLLRIRPTGSGATQKIRTVGDVPAARSLAFDIRFSAKGRITSQAAYRHQWGGDGEYAMSLRFEHDNALKVQQKRGGVWNTVRTVHNLKCNLAGGEYRGFIRIINGLLCININEHAIWIPFSTFRADGKQIPSDASWPAGKMYLNCFNCVASVAVGIIKYATVADEPYTGTVGRFGRKNSPVRDEETVPVLKFRGWSNGGTTITGTIAIESLGWNYTVTLTASPEGIHTPFLSHVYCRYRPLFVASSPSGTDLRAALLSMDIRLPSLPGQKEAEATIVLDAALIRLISGGLAAIDKYCPVEIRARRKYVDGTYMDAGWVHLFKGYAMQLAPAIKGTGYVPGLGSAADGTITITCRNQMLRFQKPAAFIDHRDAPHDVLLSYSTTGKFYGADGVADIVQTHMGDDEAAKLNGNGQKLRFFSEPIPLIDSESDTGGFLSLQNALTGAPMTDGTFFFPAKYRANAINWIEDYEDYDKAIFAYLQPGGYVNDWDVPCYGRIPQFLAEMNEVTISDSVLLGNAETLILEHSMETRPDRDINRAYAVANPPGGNSSDLLPGARIAVDQLTMPDVNAPERDWERTADVSSDWGFVEGGVEALTAGFIFLMKDSPMKWAPFLCRGNPYLHWGTRVTFELATDINNNALNLDGQTFRCEQPRHQFDLTGGTTDYWVTSIQARPTSRGVF